MVCLFLIYADITSPLLKGVLKAAKLAKFDTTEEKEKRENVEQFPKVGQQSEMSSSSSKHKPTSPPESGSASTAIATSSGVASKEDDCAKGACAQATSGKQESLHLVDQIKGVIYGNCIGDAIGLLTEFMSKDMAKKVLYNQRRYFN